MTDTATAPLARRVIIQPYDIEAGPLGHLQAERERLAGLVWQHFVRFRWTPGSIAFWANRAVRHYASSDYWPARRVMERATIIGDRPV